MEDDWDLNAVVRSCTASTSTTTTTANAVGGAPPQLSTETTADASMKDWNDFSFPTTFQDPFSPITEPHEAYPNQQHGNAALNLNPAVSSPWSLPISPFSVVNGLPDVSGEQQKLANQTQSLVFEQRQDHLPPSVSEGPKAPRSKKRKNKLKKVFHVPTEQVKSDMWAWKKYGQKLIKGTPHPRSYYKCTSKTCPARKLVEQSRSDQAMSIVTYVSKHNHTEPPPRRSAARTARSASANAAAAASSLADVLSPVTGNPENLLDAQSLDHALIEDEEDDLFISADVPIEDDFFEGLEDLPGGRVREFGADDFFEGLEDLPGEEFGMDDIFKDL